MKVFVNGSPEDLPPGSTVAEVVESRSRSDRGIAVAVNGQVLSRPAWPRAALSDGDRIEILTAVQGG